MNTHTSTHTSRCVEDGWRFFQGGLAVENIPLRSRFTSQSEGQMLYCQHIYIYMIFWYVVTAFELYISKPVSCSWCVLRCSVSQGYQTTGVSKYLKELQKVYQHHINHITSTSYLQPIIYSEFPASLQNIKQHFVEINQQHGRVCLRSHLLAGIKS